MQTKPKLYPQTLLRKAIPLRIETWIQVSFLFQKAYQMLTAFYNWDRHHCQNMSENSACLGEHDWAQLYSAPTHDAKPSDSSCLSVRTGSERCCCTVMYTACKLFLVTLARTPHYWKSQADLSLFGCSGNTRLLSYLERGGESPHCIQNILLSTSESLRSSDFFFVRWEMLWPDFKKQLKKPKTKQQNQNEFCHYLQYAINSFFSRGPVICPQNIKITYQSHHCQQLGENCWYCWRHLSCLEKPLVNHSHLQVNIYKISKKKPPNPK